jgi:MFS family permease
MSRQENSRRAIRVAFSGIAILFLIRGAFLPYFFPAFEHLTPFTYGQITILLNFYVLSQSVCAPFAGWLTDRTSVTVAVTTALLLGILGLVTVLYTQVFAVSALAMVAAGIGFVMGKIAFNTLLVESCSSEELRGSVATRAAFLNLGSFCGNALAVRTIDQLGYKPLIVLLAALNLSLAVVFLAPHLVAQRQTSMVKLKQLALALRSRAFLSDTLRLFSVYVPYGCWGTIIPKYVMDVHQSIEPVQLMYFTSMCTVVIGSYLINGYLAKKVYAFGFKWEWWTIAAKIFFYGGLLLLTFSQSQILLAAATMLFICGEIVLTPCLPETAKRHGQAGDAGTYQGMLHLFEGGGRVVGSSTALLLYVWFQASPLVGYYWPMMVLLFCLFSTSLHWMAYRLRRPAAVTGDIAEIRKLTISSRRGLLAAPELAQ